jgi:hypothetical protein
MLVLAECAISLHIFTLEERHQTNTCQVLHIPARYLHIPVKISSARKAFLLLADTIFTQRNKE